MPTLWRQLNIPHANNKRISTDQSTTTKNTEHINLQTLTITKTKNHSTTEETNKRKSTRKTYIYSLFQRNFYQQNTL